MENNNVNEIPLSIRIDELKKGIIDGLQQSNIPFCVSEMLLLNIYNEIHNLAIKEYNSDLNKYKTKVGE